MLKEIIINVCKCEKCMSVVDSIDTYCYKCGNKLDEKISYVEKTESNYTDFIKRKNLY